LFDQRIKGAQHSGLPALIAQHSEAPAGFVFVDSSQVSGCGDKARHLPADPMGLLLVASHHVSFVDEGSNCAEPQRVTVAGITLVPVGGYGFRAAQPATTVGDDGRRR
jgi:hypothetical protein